MDSALTTAVRSVLNDREVKAALIGWLQGNTPERKRDWRCVWSQEVALVREFKLTPDPRMGVGTAASAERFALAIAGYYSPLGDVVAVKYALVVPKDDRSFWRIGRAIKFGGAVALVKDFTEAIVFTQSCQAYAETAFFELPEDLSLDDMELVEAFGTQE